MTMRVSSHFGTVEVPDGWTDETVVQFYSPSVNAPVTDITRKDLPPVQTKGVASITRVKLPKGGVAEYLAEKERAMAASLTGVKVKSREPLAHPALNSVPAWEVEYELAPDLPVHQLQAFVASPGGETATVLTFVTHTRYRAEHRKSFEGIFSSFRPA